jgi:ABC-type multidrug transport system fused ATPase/permease subunit
MPRSIPMSFNITMQPFQLDDYVESLSSIIINNYQDDIKREKNKALDALIQDLETKDKDQQIEFLNKLNFHTKTYILTRLSSTSTLKSDPDHVNFLLSDTQQFIDANPITAPVDLIAFKAELIKLFGEQEGAKICGRLPNDTSDLGQITPLATTDMLNALNELEELDDEGLLAEILEETSSDEIEDLAEALFFTVLGALFGGGVFALISSTLRSGQFKEEYELLGVGTQQQQQDKETERKKKKKAIIELIKKNPKLKIALYKRLYKVIPDSAQRKQTVIEENNFQRGKWFVFGALQLGISIAAAIALGIAVGVFAKDIILVMTIMAPLISLILTVSMAFMAHRFYQKWQEAKQEVATKQKELDEKVQKLEDVKARMKLLNDTRKNDTIIDQPQNNMIAKLLNIQLSLETEIEDLKVELDSLKHHEKQRHIKFGLYMGATIISTLATLAGIAFVAVGFIAVAPIIAPVLGIVSASLVGLAAVTLLVYLGYNIAQLVIVHNAKNTLKAELAADKAAVQQPAAASVSTSSTTKPVTTSWMSRMSSIGSTLKAALIPPAKLSPSPSPTN